MWMDRDYYLPDGSLAPTRLGETALRFAPMYDGWYMGRPRWRLGDAATSTQPGVSPVSGDWVTQIASTLTPLATSIMTGLNEQKLLDYNLRLIAAGKAPLTPEQLAALQAGTAPQVNVGLGTDTQSLVRDALIGAGVLAGVFLLVHAMKGSRRR